jgi:ribonuclease HII
MPSRKSSKAEQLALQLCEPPPARRATARARRWKVHGLVAGVDEAGRGPLAGPVVAAAVILDELQPIAGLNDSKQLSPRTRERLFDEIRARALCCSIAQASVEEIDRLNILQATLLAMRRAVEGLRLLPQRVLVDGNQLPLLRMPAEAVIGGDATVAAISAASILAKVHRDRLCLALHEAHPDYGFADHKGYATPEHLAALRRHGPCGVHRQSFAPVREAAARVVVADAMLPAPAGPLAPVELVVAASVAQELAAEAAPSSAGAAP